MNANLIKDRSDICILGDSVARGVVYDEIKNKYRFLKDNFINLLSKEENIEIKNFSKFGSTILNGEETLNKNIDKIRECKCTFLEFGGNDCNFNWSEVSENPEANHLPKVPVEDFKKEYKKIIKTIKKEGSKPILLSLPPLSVERFFEWISSGLSKKRILKFLKEKEYIYRWHELYNATIFDLGREECVDVIDIRKVFLEHKNIEEFLCIDGMHPNEKGHKLINEALLDYNMISDL